MKKSRRAAVICICLPVLCLLAGCRHYNPRQNFQYYLYEINGEDVTDSQEDLFFADCEGICQYSVSEQEIVTIYDGTAPFVVTEDYIFYIITYMNDDMEYMMDLWRCDRQSGETELLETRAQEGGGISPTTYGDLLFYGDLDILVCPIDGVPAEESISLLEQFPQEEETGERQEITYQGLRVGRLWNNKRQKYYIQDITDEESGEIIFWRKSGDPQEWATVSADGEWITFYADYYYQREGEDTRRRIDCLSDDVYDRSELGGEDFTLEDGKLIGRLTVDNHPLAGTARNVVQYDVVRDVLFEIDLENDTSQILYRTRNNRTRIVGYKYGMVYLLHGDVVYQEDLETEEREEIYDMEEDGWSLYDDEGYHRDFSFRWHGDYLIISGILEDGTWGVRSVYIPDKTDENP